MDEKLNGYEQRCSDISSFNVSVLDEIRTKSANRLIIGNFNINSLSTKFDLLKVLIQEKTDILIITETKLDSICSLEQIVISGYSKPYRLDRNRSGESVIYIGEDMPR